jgi:uncharacterized protein YybS (DUF2232 family)
LRPFSHDMTKDLLNGIAITGCLTAAASTMPILGFFFLLFAPLPVFFYRAKLGRRLGAVIPAVVLCLTAVMTDFVSADLSFLLGFLMLGFALGEWVERDFSIEKTVLYTCGTVFLILSSVLVLYSFFLYDHPVALISAYVKQNLEYTLSLYKSMGVPENGIRVIEDSMDKIQYILVRSIPALILGSSLFVAWINLLAARPIFIGKGIAYPDFGSLNRWKSPETLVWGVIVGGLLMLIPNLGAKTIGLNLLLVLLVIYFFQGIAIVAFFFEKKNLPRILRVFLYSLIGFQQVLVLFVVGMGFFDVWMDVRKLNGEKKQTL